MGAHRTVSTSNSELEVSQLEQLEEDVEGDFTQLISSYYRDEMRRAMTWRERLDRTTNWSLVITATLLTWVFSDQTHPHYVVLIGMGAVILFLFVEAHRYRVYDVWRFRLRLVEENFIATSLGPGNSSPSEWRQRISEDLRNPALRISMSEAIQHRLRRVYLPLLTVLWVAWIARISAFRVEDSTFLESASIGGIPGSVSLIAVALCTLAILVLGFWPGKQEAHGKMKNRSHSDRFWSLVE